MSLKMIFVVALYLLLMLGGQLVWKRGLGFIPGAFDGSITNAVISIAGSLYIWGGVLLYGFATFLWLYLLSKFDLSYIYPLTSLAFVLGVAAGSFVLGEAVTWNRVAGSLVIMVGVYLVTLR